MAEILEEFDHPQKSPEVPNNNNDRQDTAEDENPKLEAKEASSNELSRGSKCDAKQHMIYSKERIKMGEAK